jgi:hypothetical protein
MEFSWTDKEDIWDFDHCTIGIARTLDNELIGVVRSSTNKNSNYMGDKPVELRFMLGFPINKVTEPASELYTARKKFLIKKKGQGNDGYASSMMTTGYGSGQEMEKISDHPAYSSYTS